VKRLLAQILPKSSDPESEPMREETDRKNLAAPSSETPPHNKVTEVSEGQHESRKPERAEVAPQNPTQHAELSETENAAPQKTSAPQNELTSRRGHGKAMPR
jgi:hypothetical protein